MDLTLDADVSEFNGELTADDLDQVAGGLIWKVILVRAAAKAIIWAGEKVIDAVRD